MPARAFWLPLAVSNFIDRHVHDQRNREYDLGAKKRDEKKKYLNISSQEVYLQDFLFFLGKGIKFHYLKVIFEDFKKYDALEIDSVRSKIKGRKEVGYNQYSQAKQKKLYAHVIDSAKKVYSLRGYDTQEKNDGALLVLIHDMGKISQLMKDLQIPTEKKHEISSALYASIVVVDKEDHKLLESYQDWLVNSPTNRKIKGNVSGEILEKVDGEDRKSNQIDLLGKNRNLDSHIQVKEEII